MKRFAPMTSSSESPRLDPADGQDPALLPAYSMAEAARLTGLPVSTLRSWCRGQGTFQPVLELDDPQGRALSFRNLVEVHVLSAIRRQFGVSLQNVRRAVEFLRARLQSDHPLADGRMLTDGRDLLVREGEVLLNASRRGQGELAIVAAYLERIEVDARGALLRLYPFTRQAIESDPRAVVIDPRIQFGRPCLRGTGVPTDALSDRFVAGESIEDLAADYGIDPGLIEEAVRYERGSRAA